MTSKVGVINYGLAGNIKSIQKAIQHTGANAIFIDDPKDLSQVNKLVLPGVGSFPTSMAQLHKAGWFTPLKERLADMPTLGICLGMHLLTKIGHEQERTEGFGIIDAKTTLIEQASVIPHMGFNNLSIVQDCSILKGLSNAHFYFMHSYCIKSTAEKHKIATTKYEKNEFVSVIQNEHVFGVQFHPEKSRAAGIELFSNFVNF